MVSCAPLPNPPRDESQGQQNPTVPLPYQLRVLSTYLELPEFLSKTADSASKPPHSNNRENTTSLKAGGMRTCPAAHLLGRQPSNVGSPQPPIGLLIPFSITP